MAKWTFKYLPEINSEVSTYNRIVEYIVTYLPGLRGVLTLVFWINRDTGIRDRMESVDNGFGVN